MLINSLEIKNFKSIRDIKLEPKQINIFIGDTNSGKSNILEALGIISLIQRPNQIKQYIRFQSFSNLFYDDLTDKDIEFKLNDINLTINFDGGRFFLSENYTGSKLLFDFDGNNTGSSGDLSNEFNLLQLLRYYQFKDRKTFKSRQQDYLNYPDGNNLFSVIFGNKQYRNKFKNLLEPFDYKPVFKPQKQEIEYQKQENDIIINYPYELLSGTLRSLIFYFFMIESNQDACLIFEEPETHTFPYYTKFLGEKIARDQSNQYFIITHNPYFLKSIIEKAPKNKINVYVTYMEDYETKIANLSQNEISSLLDVDPFFNLNKFTGDE